mgnify:CR=1 FL=1
MVLYAVAVLAGIVAGLWWAPGPFIVGLGVGLALVVPGVAVIYLGAKKLLSDSNAPSATAALSPPERADSTRRT